MKIYKVVNSLFRREKLYLQDTSSPQGKCAENTETVQKVNEQEVDQNKDNNNVPSRNCHCICGIIRVATGYFPLQYFPNVWTPCSLQYILDKATERLSMNEHRDDIIFAITNHQIKFHQY